jgi:NAD(P)H-dependent FMN reductase
MSTRAKDDLRVVGISGSIRAGSYTRMALAEALAGAGKAGAVTELIDLREYRLPFVTTPDGDEQNQADVQKLHSQVSSADGIILATPEYHGSFSGVLKSALDLMGFEQFEGKMVGLVGVSGGRMGASDALHSLRGIGRALHAWVLPQQASVPEAWSVFDADGHIKNEALGRRLRDVGAQVAKFARVHKCADAQEFLEMWQQAPENPGGA